MSEKDKISEKYKIYAAKPGERLVPREVRIRRRYPRRHAPPPVPPFPVHRPGQSFSPDLRVLDMPHVREVLRGFRRKKESISCVDIVDPCIVSSFPRASFHLDHCRFRQGFRLQGPPKSFIPRLSFQYCFCGSLLSVGVSTEFLSFVECAAVELQICPPSEIEGTKKTDPRQVDHLSIQPSARGPSLFRRVVFSGEIRRSLSVVCHAEEVVFTADFVPPSLEQVTWDVAGLQRIDMDDAPSSWQAFMRERHPHLFPSVPDPS